jgi:hypothetical protein
MDAKSQPSQEIVVVEKGEEKTPPKPIPIKKGPPSRHAVSSPTSKNADSDSDTDSDSDAFVEDEEESVMVQTWPKIPSFINEKKDLSKGDEAKVLAYMLGADTDAMTMSRLEHLIHTFVSNEKFIQKAYDNRNKFEDKGVQRLMKNRSKLVATLHSILEQK